MSNISFRSNQSFFCMHPLICKRFMSSSRKKIGEISGYRTFTPAEATEIHRWQTILKRVFEQYGFSPVQNRPVEKVDHLVLKGGLTKEIYALTRIKGEQKKIGLPFDRTLPFAISIARQLNTLIFPYKRYDIDYSFRGERPGAGRFRAFLQADIDIADRKMGRNVHADAECFATVIHSLKQLKIPPFAMHINHIKIVKGMITSFGARQEEVPACLKEIDKMEKLGKEEVLKKIQVILPQISPVKIENLVEQFDYRGPLEKFPLKSEWGKEAEDAYQDLHQLFLNMKKLGIASDEISYNARMVRGLDYYTGAVFETFFSGDLEKIGSIASGGRYDQLVDAFLGRETNIQGVGGSIGVTRLFDQLIREEQIKPQREGNSHVLVAFRSAEQVDKATEIAQALRGKGYNVDLYSGAGKITDQLSYADKKFIPFIVMVMNEKNSFVVKDMQFVTDRQRDYENPSDAILDVSTRVNQYLETIQKESF